MPVLAIRLLVWCALLLALYVAAQWLASPGLPASMLAPADRALRVQLFPLLALQVTTILRGGHAAVAYASYALIAATLLLAATLAAWLAWRGLQRATVRYLAAALALMSIAVAHFWFLREFSPLRSLLALRDALDYVAMLCGIFALVAFVACFRIYPEAFSRESVRRDSSLRVSGRNAQSLRIRRGEGFWRLWSWLPQERYGTYGRTRSPELAGVSRMLRSRECLWLLGLVAIISCGLLYSPVMADGALALRLFMWTAVALAAIVVLDPVFGARCDEARLLHWVQQREHTALFDFENALHGFLGRPPGLALTAGFALALTALWHRAVPEASALSALLISISLIVTLGHALSLLYLNWRHGAAEQRRAIAWIFLGTAGVTALWMMAILIVGLFMVFRWHLVGDGGPEARSLQGSIALLGPPAIALAFVLSLWASILHRGSFDPGLALRRGAGYAVLGIVLTAIFVAVEGAVSSLVVVHFGMPSQSGPVLAGTAVALGFGPLRERVERGVQHVMQRLLPPEAVAAGERRECAIVFSDLSGYTRLAEIDEAEAVTWAALLHRNARIVADAHQGRVVKTIGDAVLCVYPDAGQAIAAVRALHQSYRNDAQQRDSEPLPVHSGVHVGEVVIAPDGDVFGASVNLAARLQGLAGPDEVVASMTAAAALADAGLQAEALPARRFKHIQEPVDCLRLRLA